MSRKAWVYTDAMDDNERVDWLAQTSYCAKFRLRNHDRLVSGLTIPWRAESFVDDVCLRLQWSSSGPVKRKRRRPRLWSSFFLSMLTCIELLMSVVREGNSLNRNQLGGSGCFLSSLGADLSCLPRPFQEKCGREGKCEEAWVTSGIHSSN